MAKKNHELPPILITSCVKTSANYTALRDQNTRIELTVNAINEWLKINSLLKIVVCDGSGINFSGRLRREFPLAQIEFIHFKNNYKLAKIYGKGYGEGQIVEYALKKSKFLKCSPFFAKCTSKLVVKNFMQVIELWNGNFIFDAKFINVGIIKNLLGLVSVRSISLILIDTRFYIVDKKKYLKFFSKSHLDVRDSERYILEHAFRDVILSHKIRNFMLSFPFLIEGVSGTSGKSYRKNNIFSYIKKCLHRQIIRKHPLYKNFFVS